MERQLAIEGEVKDILETEGVLSENMDEVAIKVTSHISSRVLNLLAALYAPENKIEYRCRSGELIPVIAQQIGWFISLEDWGNVREFFTRR